MGKIRVEFVDEDTPFEESSEEETSTRRDSEFAKLLAEDGKATSYKSIRVGEKISARVLSVSESAVYFDVGQRSEGVLPKEELGEEGNSLEVGQVLTLYVKSVANGIELTKALSARQASFDSLQDAWQSGLPVEGKVSAENKGGFTVELAGVRAFCPFSQMDTVRRPAGEYIGKSFPFQVTKIQGKDVVLSRTQILRAEEDKERQKLMSQMTPAQVMPAKVLKLEKFGIFVDLGGGVHALVPLSELSWSRQVQPHSMYAPGDRVNVKILQIDTSGPKPRISASIKQVDVDPWDLVVDTYSVGQKFQAVITRLMAFGAFAELSPGVEGLIHISEMSHKKRVLQPGEVVKSGDRVEVQVLSIDRLSRRIALSLKALEADTLDAEARQKYLKSREVEESHRGVEHISAGGSGSSLGEAFLKARKMK